MSAPVSAMMTSAVGLADPRDGRQPFTLAGKMGHLFLDLP
jgi:hypothetical protein